MGRLNWFQKISQIPSDPNDIIMQLLSGTIDQNSALQQLVGIGAGACCAPLATAMYAAPDNKKGVLMTIAHELGCNDQQQQQIQPIEPEQAPEQTQGNMI